VLRHPNLKRELFHADDCKKKEEEINRAQDGCEEASTQGREKEEGPESKAEGKAEIAGLVSQPSGAQLMLFAPLP
jgi:hypothetical protein